jgi:transcriptional regulator with XRE-family HTH domain
MELSLGERIRIHRTRLGLSQTELASRVGISKNSMNEIERGGTADPRFSTVVAIAACLGLKLDELVEPVNTPDPAPRKRPRKAAPVA